MSTPELKVMNPPSLDIEKARQYRSRMLDAVERVQQVMADAQAEGMVITVGPFGVDQFGRPLPVQVSVQKVLA